MEENEPIRENVVIGDEDYIDVIRRVLDDLEITRYITLRDTPPEALSMPTI